MPMRTRQHVHTRTCSMGLTGLSCGGGAAMGTGGGSTGATGTPPSAGGSMHESPGSHVRRHEVTKRRPREGRCAVSLLGETTRYGADRRHTLIPCCSVRARCLRRQHSKEPSQHLTLLSSFLDAYISTLRLLASNLTLP